MLKSIRKLSIIVIKILFAAMNFFYLLCLDDLPPVPRLMAELVGLEKCQKILDSYGGSRLNFPAGGFSPEHPLRDFLDDDDCLLLSKYFLGTVNIPVGKSAVKTARDRAIWRDSEIGLSARELSRKYELCERQIQNSIKAHLERLRNISDSVPIAM